MLSRGFGTEKAKEGGQGGRRGKAFERIFMLSSAFRTERGGTGARARGHGDRRGRSFGCILMLSGAFVTEREGQEGGESDRGTGGERHLGAFACFRAHLGRRGGDRREERGTWRHEGDCI